MAEHLPQGKEPAVIGITGLTPYMPTLKELVPRLKSIYPGARIILGGPHFSVKPLDAFALGADAVCIGDGEEAILSAIYAGRGTMRGFINVNDWPQPARHLLDMHAYKYAIAGLPATSIITARGCGYSCAYCSRDVSTRTVRYRALEWVAKEVESIKQMGFGGLQIYDDEANLSNSRLYGLCEVLKSAGMKWRCFIRANLFTMEQAMAMQDAGCVEVCCGVESGSDVILSAMNKRAAVADSTRARLIAQACGLRFKAFCMIGLPGETEESVLLTKKWLLDMAPDDFDLCPFTPYPGSDIADHPEKYDIVLEQDYWKAVYFHKGSPGGYRIGVHTKGLSAGRLAELRDQVDADVRAVLHLEGPV